MKNIKLVTMLLAVIILLSFIGCGTEQVSSASLNSNNNPPDFAETQNNNEHKAVIGFDAKVGKFDVVLDNIPESDRLDWIFDKIDIDIDAGPFREESLKESERIFKINGQEYTVVYKASGILDTGETIHSYSGNGWSCSYDTAGKLTSIIALGDNHFECDYIPTNKEQREELARKAIKEYLGFDAKDFICTEEEKSDGSKKVRFIYYVNGKQTDKKLSVYFDKEGKLYLCSLTGCAKVDDYSEYPDFDGDQCYKTAEAKFFEIIKHFNTPCRYGTFKKIERISKIDGKFYNVYRFRYANALAGQTEHQLITDQEKVNNLPYRLDIYVELKTE